MSNPSTSCGTTSRSHGGDGHETAEVQVFSSAMEAALSLGHSTYTGTVAITHRSAD